MKILDILKKITIDDVTPKVEDPTYWNFGRMLLMPFLVVIIGFCLACEWRRIVRNARWEDI
jgi:hypothetical protein